MKTINYKNIVAIKNLNSLREKALEQIKHENKKENIDVLNSIHDKISSSIDEVINKWANLHIVDYIREFNSVDWINASRDSNPHIKYIKKINDKEYFTIKSLLNYSMREIEIEKLVWYYIENIINQETESESSREFILNNSHGEGYNNYKKIRTIYLRHILNEYYNITLVDVLMQELYAA